MLQAPPLSSRGESPGVTVPVSLPAGSSTTATSEDAALDTSSTNAAILVPLWFTKSSFTADDFEPDEYIRAMRRYVPLNSLQEELERHLVSLKAEVGSLSPLNIFILVIYIS